ncbi:MAG: DNA-protecting protein DprA, partial [Desulfobacterales bacterium]|nr:DNA-protecting protein DprA [Desulfobacterales bacterium]
ASRTCLSPEENALIEAMGPYPVHIDELARKLSLAPGKISGLLLQLELKGSIRQLPGNFFTCSS